MNQDKPNTGALFKNDYKEREGQPDYKGPFTGPNGEPQEVAAWLNESKGGKKYMKVEVRDKREKSEPKPEPAAQPDEPYNDPIPF